MRLVVLVALLVAMGGLLAGPVAAPAAAQSSEVVTLTVSVVDRGGEPIGGADLTATWENGSTTATTTSNGKAFVDVPRGTNVTVEVSHPAFVRNHPFAVRNATQRDVTIPVSREARLSVAVADTTGAVADARVVLRQDGRVVAQAPTGDDGAFVSDRIEEGEYTVAVLKRGYFRNVTAVDVSNETRADITIERGTVILTVGVRDPQFSPPGSVGNATVRVGSVGQIQTLESGDASLSVPVNTDLSVGVEKAGYDGSTTSVSVGESDLRVNLSISRTPSLRVEPLGTRVVAGERLSVEVVDEYGDPVAGATILLDDESAGTTDADGRAAVTVAEPGNHTLAAATADLTADPTTIRAIPEGGTTATEPPSTTPAPTATGTDSDPGTGLGVPGFTPLTALLAVATALAVLAVRRR